MSPRKQKIKWEEVDKKTKPQAGWLLIHDGEKSVRIRMGDTMEEPPTKEQKKSSKKESRGKRRKEEIEAPIKRNTELLSSKLRRYYGELEEEEEEDWDEREEIEEVYEIVDEEEEEEEEAYEWEYEQRAPKPKREKVRSAQRVFSRETLTVENEGVLYAKVLPNQFAVLTYEVTNQYIAYMSYDGVFGKEDVLDLLLNGAVFEVREEGEVEEEWELYEVFKKQWKQWIGREVEIIPIVSNRWLNVAKIGVIYDVAPFKKREFYHHRKG